MRGTPWQGFFVATLRRRESPSAVVEAGQTDRSDRDDTANERQCASGDNRPMAYKCEARGRRQRTEHAFADRRVR